MYRNNNSEKHYISARRRERMRRRKQRKLLIAITTILCASICGVTLSYVVTGTDPVKNIFEGAYVACEVLENGTDGQGDFDGKEKTNVRIQNTGNVQSYIRAKVVVTWMSVEGDSVTASKPVDGTDYEIIYANETAEATNWKQGADGYWYYTVPVDVGDATQNLIERCYLKEGATVPEGFRLSVEIVASSIQSTPVSVAVDQWESGVSGADGVTLAIKE